MALVELELRLLNKTSDGRLHHCLHQSLQLYVPENQAVLHLWFSKEMKNNGLNWSPYSRLFFKDNHAMTVTQRTYFLISFVIFALPRRLIFLSIPLKIWRPNLNSALKIYLMMENNVFVPWFSVRPTLTFYFCLLFSFQNHITCFQWVGNDLERFILLVYFYKCVLLNAVLFVWWPVSSLPLVPCVSLSVMTRWYIRVKKTNHLLTGFGTELRRILCPSCSNFSSSRSMTA